MCTKMIDMEKNQYFYTPSPNTILFMHGHSVQRCHLAVVCLQNSKRKEQKRAWTSCLLFYKTAQDRSDDRMKHALSVVDQKRTFWPRSLSDRSFLPPLQESAMNVVADKISTDQIGFSSSSNPTPCRNCRRRQARPLCSFFKTSFNMLRKGGWMGLPSAPQVLRHQKVYGRKEGVGSSSCYVTLDTVARCVLFPVASTSTT